MDDARSLQDLREELEKKLILRLIQKTDSMELHEAAEVFRTLHESFSYVGKREAET